MIELPGIAASLGHAGLPPTTPIHHRRHTSDKIPRLETPGLRKIVGHDGNQDRLPVDLRRKHSGPARLQTFQKPVRQRSQRLNTTGLDKACDRPNAALPNSGCPVDQRTNRLTGRFLPRMSRVFPETGVLAQEIERATKKLVGPGLHCLSQNSYETSVLSASLLRDCARDRLYPANARSDTRVGYYRECSYLSGSPHVSVSMS